MVLGENQPLFLPIAEVFIVNVFGVTAGLDAVRCGEGLCFEAVC